MRHRIFGNKLHRNKKLRKQLFKNLASNFIKNGKLSSTPAKIAAVRFWIEKLVTKAKQNNGQSRRLLYKELADSKIVKELLKIGKDFSRVQGGYTKVIKISPRLGDGSDQALLLWSQERTAEKQPEPEKNGNLKITNEKPEDIPTINKRKKA